MKKVLGILVVIVMFSLVFNTVPVLAFGSDFNYGNVPQENEGDTNNLNALKTPVNKVANTIFYVVQIVAIAGVIILGVKYMFTSANKRAEYKTGLVMIVIGLMLVFCATTVAQFVVNIYTEAVTESSEELL